MKTLKKTAKKRHFFNFFPRIGIRCFWKVFGNCTCWSLDQHSKFGVSQRIASVPTTPTPKMSPPPLKSGRYRPSIGPPGQMYPRYKCRQADLNSWGYKVFGNIGLRNSPGGGRVSPISSRTITSQLQKRHVCYLTLPMLRLLSSKAQGVKIFENHLNPVMLVFIG